MLAVDQAEGEGGGGDEERPGAVLTGGGGGGSSWTGPQTLSLAEKENLSEPTQGED